MKNIKKLIFNRFTFILFAFIVWMAFFDQNNLMLQYKLIQKLNEAKHNEWLLRNEIKTDSLNVFQLQTDLNAVEKLGREWYNMKKDDETIFLIVRDEEKIEPEEK